MRVLTRQRSAHSETHAKCVMGPAQTHCSLPVVGRTSSDWLLETCRPVGRSRCSFLRGVFDENVTPAPNRVTQ